MVGGVLKLSKVSCHASWLVPGASFKADGFALLHNNELSCRVPTCSNSSLKLSLAGLGNEMRRPGIMNKKMFMKIVLVHRIPGQRSESLARP